MISITLGNSYSSIKGLSPKAEKQLRDKLSYVVGGSSAYFSKYGPRRKSLLSKRGEFPTGLLGRVVEEFDYKTTLVVDKRTKPAYKPTRSKTYTESYLWQKAAVEVASAFGRGTISAVTGSGKSRVIKLLAEYYGLKTLVIVPSLEIKKQLQSDFKDMPLVRVENIDSKVLNTLKNIDVLIIDEAHHSASATYQKLNKTAWSTIYYRFFLTATPFRNDAEETLLYESIAGDLIYSLSYKDAVVNGYIVPVEAYILEVPKQKTDAFTYQQVYSQLVVNNTAANELIGYTLLMLNQAKINTLCLVTEVAHGNKLSELTGLPFVNGADNDSRDYIDLFNRGEIPAIIATTGVMGEGVDSKAAEYVIIAGMGKAKSRFQQQVGRVLRKYKNKESGKVIIIRNTGHKYLLRHFNAQVKILLDEYGVKPVKLDL
jgi:superfamily II DNA or RNA helicase